MEATILNAEIIAPILTMIVTIAGAYGVNLKKKITAARELMEEIEKANADNSITPDEFTGIVNTAKKIIG